MLYGFRIEGWISKSLSEKIESYEKLNDITNRADFYRLFEKIRLILSFLIMITIILPK